MIVFKENKGSRGRKVVSEGQLVGGHCQNQQEGRSSSKTMWVGRVYWYPEKNQLAERCRLEIGTSSPSVHQKGCKWLQLGRRAYVVRLLVAGADGLWVSQWGP